MSARWISRSALPRALGMCGVCCLRVVVAVLSLECICVGVGVGACAYALACSQPCASCSDHGRQRRRRLCASKPGRDSHGSGVIEVRAWRAASRPSPRGGWRQRRPSFTQERHKAPLRWRRSVRVCTCSRRQRVELACFGANCQRWSDPTAWPADKQAPRSRQADACPRTLSGGRVRSRGPPIAGAGACAHHSVVGG